MLPMQVQGPHLRRATAQRCDRDHGLAKFETVACLACCRDAWVRRTPRSGRSAHASPRAGTPLQLLTSVRALILPQLLHQPFELLEGGLEVLDDLPRQHVGLGEVFRVLEALVPQPEDVQVHLVPLEQLVVGEGPKTLGLLAVVGHLAYLSCPEGQLELHQAGGHGSLLV